MAPTGKLFRAASSRRLVASKFVAKATATLNTKKCLAIANRLGDAYLKKLPWKLQELTRRLKQGLVAKGKRHLEPEKATAILGKVLREINAGLHQFVSEATATVDGADAEREARVAVAAAAESKLAELRNAVVDCSRAEKEALQNIDDRRAAISEAKAARQSREMEAKKVQGRKRNLEAIERESYEPLRVAPADGPEGRKCLAGLRRAGKAYGFHKELLSIAPVILRKPLESRHTFEDLIVQQLTSEFAKNAGSLDVHIKHSKEAIMECEEQLQIAEAELANARAVHKEAVQARGAAEAAVVEGRQTLVEAKNCVRKLPADLKRAERSLAQAEACLLKFQRGPRAAFEKALGLAFGAVASMTETRSSYVAETESDTSDP